MSSLTSVIATIHHSHPVKQNVLKGWPQENLGSRKVEGLELSEVQQFREEIAERA